MLRAAKTKSPREVEILDMGQRILQPPPKYLHSLSKLSRTSNTFIFKQKAESLELLLIHLLQNSVQSLISALSPDTDSPAGQFNLFVGQHFLISSSC